MKKSGVQVVKEINAIVKSGDCSNDTLIEQIKEVLKGNSHLLEEKK